jgi:hypothetical protein
VKKRYQKAIEKNAKSQATVPSQRSVLEPSKNYAITNLGFNILKLDLDKSDSDGDE